MDYGHLDELLWFISTTSALQTQEHMHCNSYGAFWMGEQGLVLRKTFQMYCSPTTKSACPILEWKQGDPNSNVVTCCVNVTLIDFESKTWIVRLKNRFINLFIY